MTIRYFEKIKKRIAKLEWLIERESIDTEYDEDADVGIVSGSITFKDGSVFHFKEVFLEKSRQYRYHYMDERNNLNKPPYHFGTQADGHTHTSTPQSLQGCLT